MSGIDRWQEAVAIRRLTIYGRYLESLQLQMEGSAIIGDSVVRLELRYGIGGLRIWS